MHPPQERLEAGVGVQRGEEEGALHSVQSAGSLAVSSLQALDRTVVVPEPGVDVGQMVGRDLLLGCHRGHSVEDRTSVPGPACLSIGLSQLGQEHRVAGGGLDRPS